jgi:hypothetical protein
MNILVFKLTSGEEVIGSLVEDLDDDVIIGKARVLVMQQTHDGGIGLGMIPFMPSANDPSTGMEKDVKIKKCFVMAEPVEVPKSLEDAYLKTTSNIQLA